MNFWNFLRANAPPTFLRLLDCRRHLAIMHSLPLFFLFKLTKAASRTLRSPPPPSLVLAMPLLGSNRKLNLLLRGRVILLLEKINGPPGEMNQALFRGRFFQIEVLLLTFVSFSWPSRGFGSAEWRPV